MAKVGTDYTSLGRGNVQMIIMRDHHTKMTFAHLVVSKGASDKWALNRCVEDLGDLGCAELILKGDGEPALKQVQRELRARRRHRIVMANPPEYDPQASGSIENAVGEVLQQMRAVKLGLENNINKARPADHPILYWIVEHAPALMNRFQLGRDGRTPFRMLRGKDHDARECEFGEQVLAKIVRRRGKHRLRNQMGAQFCLGT